MVRNYRFLILILVSFFSFSEAYGQRKKDPGIFAEQIRPDINAGKAIYSWDLDVAPFIGIFTSLDYIGVNPKDCVLGTEAVVKAFDVKPAPSTTVVKSGESIFPFSQTFLNKYFTHGKFNSKIRKEILADLITEFDHSQFDFQLAEIARKNLEVLNEKYADLDDSQTEMGDKREDFICSRDLKKQQSPSQYATITSTLLTISDDMKGIHKTKNHINQSIRQFLAYSSLLSPKEQEEYVADKNKPVEEIYLEKQAHEIVGEYTVNEIEKDPAKVLTLYPDRVPQAISFFEEVLKNSTTYEFPTQYMAFEILSNEGDSGSREKCAVGDKFWTVIPSQKAAELDASSTLLYASN
jgi:hypothetical protein